MKIENPKLLASFRGRPCEWHANAATYGSQPNSKFHREIRTDTVGHHVATKGAGRLDVPFNLISLCVECHSHCHNGGEPDYVDCLQKVATREKTTMQAIEDAVDYLRLLDKDGRLPAGREFRLSDEAGKLVDSVLRNLLDEVA